MRIAVISDIHANLPALTAVLKNMQTQRVDLVYCLGDLVNFAGWDNETIELIRGKNIPSVQGNHDTVIGLHQADFPFSFKTGAQKEFGYASIKKVNKRVSEENRKYLSELPFMLQTEFRLTSAPLKIAMTHGSVWSNTEYIQENVNEDYLIKMCEATNAQVLLMGHTHIPYYKKIKRSGNDENNLYHIINVGSVGKPGHGDNQSCYCLLEIGKPVHINTSASIHVNFMFVPYDVNKVINHLKESGMSDAYDHFLLHGSNKPGEHFKPV